MTRFVDGPAAGVTLMLRRAPHFLRAVRNRQTGEWDALDQLDDAPEASEEVVVYAMEGDPTWMHVHQRRGGGGVYRGGTYRVVSSQPSDEEMRSVERWREWAQAAMTGKARS